jgi:cytochrome P450
VRNIQDAVYLNGVINEALRLHPPVPSGVLRQTPLEGLMLNGVFIPGDIIVSSPSWTMGRRMSICVTHLVAIS